MLMTDNVATNMLSLSNNMRMDGNDLGISKQLTADSAADRDSCKHNKGNCVSEQRYVGGPGSSSVTSTKIALCPSTATSKLLAASAPHSQDINHSSATGQIRVPSGSGFRMMTPFPWRLHEMLEEIEEGRQTHIVSWLPGGRSFQVHCPTQFAEIIIPKYFRHKRYKSFQRQLYLYGFTSVEDQIARGAYSHPNFIREDRQLCRLITRIKPKSANGSCQRRDAQNKQESSCFLESATFESLDQETSATPYQIDGICPPRNVLATAVPSGMIPSGMFLPLCKNQSNTENPEALYDKLRGRIEEVRNPNRQNRPMVTASTQSVGSAVFQGTLDQPDSNSNSNGQVPESQEDTTDTTGGGYHFPGNRSVGDISKTIEWLVRDARVSLADLTNILSMMATDNLSTELQSPRRAPVEDEQHLTGLREYSDTIISLFGIGTGNESWEAH